MRNRLLLASLLFTSTFTACADESWAPPESSDAVVLVDGADIPSRFADPSKQYLSLREISSLEELGVVGMGDPLLARIDNSLPGLSKYNRIELAELVHLEDELTDEELTRIWSLMSVPRMDPTVVRVPDKLFRTTLTPPTASGSGAKIILPDDLFLSETTMVGDIPVRSVVDLQVSEAREVSATLFHVSQTLDGARTMHFGSTGQKALLIHLASGDEVSTSGRSSTNAGRAVLESYEPNGVRHAHLVDWPGDGGIETSLDDYADYEVTRENGTRLEKYYDRVNDGVVKFEFRPGPLQFLDGEDADIVDAVATPIGSLAPGRYQVTSQIAVDLYETGLVIAHHAGTSQRLVHAIELEGAGRKKALKGNVAGAPLVFVPESNRLYVVGTPITVTSAMRTN